MKAISLIGLLLLNQVQGSCFFPWRCGANSAHQVLPTFDDDPHLQKRIPILQMTPEDVNSALTDFLDLDDILVLRVLSHRIKKAYEAAIQRKLNMEFTLKHVEGGTIPFKPGFKDPAAWIMLKHVVPRVLTVCGSGKGRFEDLIVDAARLHYLQSVPVFVGLLNALIRTKMFKLDDFDEFPDWRTVFMEACILGKMLVANTVFERKIVNSMHREDLRTFFSNTLFTIMSRNKLTSFKAALILAQMHRLVPTKEEQVHLLSWAVLDDRLEFVKYFHEGFLKLEISGQLFIAIDGDSRRVMQYMIPKINRFWQLKRNEKSPLHVAIEMERYEIIEMLVNCKAIRLDAADSQGKTPLEYLLAEETPNQLSIQAIIGAAKRRGLFPRIISKSYFNGGGSILDEFNRRGLEALLQ